MSFYTVDIAVCSSRRQEHACTTYMYRWNCVVDSMIVVFTWRPVSS